MKRRGALLAGLCAVLAAAAPAQVGLAQPRVPAQVGLAQPPAPVTPTPFQTPDTSACPYRLAPPPPVDHSEAPAPGQAAPVPVPVPAEPVGGEQLGGCGLLLPDSAAPLPADLTATSWVIADLDSGQIVAAKDPHGRHRPASTIKVLTALVALRKLDLATVVTGSQADAEQEGSKVGMGPGGQYTVGQLLYGLLLSSGNDAAHALAMQLGGVEATVAAMNELADQSGALDTRVTTPSGLDAPGTTTSAYDMALLFRLAMREQAFATIVGTTLVDFPGFGGKPGFKLSNDNRLLASYLGAIGGKTGFTDDARHTFIGAAERDGRRLVAVLLRGEQQPVRMSEQAARLLDYGFAAPAGSPVGQLVESSPSPPPPDSGAPVAKPAARGSVAAGETGGGSARTLVIALTALALVAAVATSVLLRRRRHSAG